MLNGRKKYAYLNLKELLSHGIDAKIIPDPLILSIFIIHLLSEGKTERAVYYSKVAITKRRKELDYARLLSFKLGGQHIIYNSLLSEIEESKGRTDIKTMYYFYSDKFNLLSTLEKIVKRNITCRRYSLNDLLLFPFTEQEVYNLSHIEEKYDYEILKNDLSLLLKDLKIYHKTIKYIQNHFN